MREMNGNKCLQASTVINVAFFVLFRCSKEI